MSVIKDIQLNGSNLCNVECMDKNAILHPETCVGQVLTTQTGPTTLVDWLTYNETNPDEPLGGFSDYSGLIPWLEEYYPIPDYTLPTANTTTKGGIKIGQYLTMTGDTLSVDITALNIPTLNNASFSTSGIIKLGNDTVLSTTFSNTPISIDSSDSYMLPLRKDANGNTGVEFDMSVMESYIYPYGVPTVNNAQITFTYDNQYTVSQNITLNQASTQTIHLKDTTYDIFVQCTDEENGANGLVPTPTAADYNKVLSAGNDNKEHWVDLPTTFTGCTDEADGKGGLIPTPEAGMQNKFLCADGGWEDISSYIQVQADWSEQNQLSPAFIQHKPTIPAAQVQADWNQDDDTKKDFIWNKPTIPAEQIQADWTQGNSTKKDYIKNKPTLIERVPAIKVVTVNDNTEEDVLTDCVKFLLTAIENNVTPSLFINSTFTSESTDETISRIFDQIYTDSDFKNSNFIVYINELSSVGRRIPFYKNNDINNTSSVKLFFGNVVESIESGNAQSKYLEFFTRQLASAKDYLTTRSGYTTKLNVMFNHDVPSGSLPEFYIECTTYKIPQ